jgi:pimeloyl-ACP methyl ester carboxylesterase
MTPTRPPVCSERMTMRRPATLAPERAAADDAEETPDVTESDAADPPEAGLGRSESRFARLAGVDVHHEVAGSPDDPTLLLLHHFYGNTATWRHVMADLGRDHHVAAFDRPGFGLTERPARHAWTEGNPYTRDASARITLGLLDRLQAHRAVLVGSSAGGTVALEAYARAPERVRALVLLSPAITGDVGPPAGLRPVLRSAGGRRLGPRVVRRLARDVTLDRVTRSWHDPSRGSEDDLDAYRRPLRIPGWERGLWEVVTAEDPPRLAGLLSRIDVPTLVVSGGSDRVIAPRWNARTAAAIGGARLEVIPACGHTPQEECPDQLTAVIRDFLDGLPA